MPQTEFVLQLYNLLVSIKCFTIAFFSGDDSFDLDFVDNLQRLIHPVQSTHKIKFIKDEDEDEDERKVVDKSQLVEEITSLAQAFLKEHPLVIDGNPLLTFDKLIWASQIDTYHRAVVELDQQRYNFILQRSRLSPSQLLLFSMIDASAEQRILQFLLNRTNWKDDRILFDWEKNPRLGGYCMLKVKQIIDSSHNYPIAEQLELQSRLRFVCKGEFVKLVKSVHDWFHVSLFLGNVDADDLVACLRDHSCSPLMPSAVSLIISYQEQLGYEEILEKLLGELSTLISSASNRAKMFRFWFNQNGFSAFPPLTRQDSSLALRPDRLKSNPIVLLDLQSLYPVQV